MFLAKGFHKWGSFIQIVSRHCGEQAENKTNKPVHEISNNVAFFRCVDSDEPLQPPFKLRNFK